MHFISLGAKDRFGPLHDGTRHGGGILDDLLQLLAGSGLEFLLRPFDLGQELGIRDGRIERPPQGIDPLRRDAGQRRRDGAAYGGAAGVEGQHLPGLIGGGELHIGRNVGQIRMSFQARRYRMVSS